MAIEAHRQIADRRSPPNEQRYSHVILNEPSFWDPKTVELLDRAKKQLQNGDLEGSRLAYTEAANREIEIFNTISVAEQKGVRDRAEYGILVITALVGANHITKAREFEQKLREDPLIYEKAKEKAGRIIDAFEISQNLQQTS
jgi:hypothetical protein